MRSNDNLKSWKEYSDKLNKEFGGKILKYCGNLNGGRVAFIPKKLKGCSSATHKKGAPTICDYKEPNIFPDEFFSGLFKLIRENQNETGACVGCRYLVETKLPKRFAAAFINTISIHDYCGCNSRCVYCSGSEYQLPEKHVGSFDHEILFQNLLKNAFINKSTSVFWGGAEPTLLKNFDRIVELLCDNHIAQTINTSGIQFSTSIEKALARNLAAVCISVDSGKNETYEKVKRNPNAENVWTTIQRYAATKGDFSVKFIIFPMNSDIDEVDYFVNRCHENGVKRVCISVDARAVYTIDSDAEKITLKELVAASSMYNLAKSKGIYPEFASIWLPEQLLKIEQLGNFSQRPNIFYRKLRKMKNLANKIRSKGAY